MPHGNLHHHKVHEVHHEDKRQLLGDVATAVNVVYVTATPTFDGPILGYVTADSQATQAPQQQQQQQAPQATQAAQQQQHQQQAPQASQQGPNFFDSGSSSAAQVQASAPAQATAGAPIFASAAASSAAASIAAASNVPAVISAPSSSVAVNTLPAQIAAASSKAPVMSSASSAAVASPPSQSGAIALATSAASSAAPTLADSQAQATPTSPSSAPAQSSPGLSAGGKAGLAIGILLALAIVGAIAFFLYRKKQLKDNEANADDEKAAMQQQGGGLIPRVSVRKGNTQAGPPRLSMRPLTDMFPDSNEKVAAPAAVALGPSPTSEPAKPLTNPFGDHAEAVVDASAVPKPLNISRPGTPTGSTSPTLSSTSGAAAAGTAAAARSEGSNGPLNVHRVQLDFSPSMEDELELRAGQLVRMLHEYDDGWALCIRLDRSQQGVVPRSCISKLPVKPRPNGPPSGTRGPQQSRSPKQPGQGARFSPTGSISSTSSNGSTHRQVGAPPGGRMRAGSAAPAPMGGQSKSNGPPQDRPRANSASGAAQPRKETAGQSPMNPAAQIPVSSTASGPARKPVPGQAV